MILKGKPKGNQHHFLGCFLIFRQIERLPEFERVWGSASVVVPTLAALVQATPLPPKNQMAGFVLVFLNQMGGSQKRVPYVVNKPQT